jgi:heme ABC exporter ATP-binding subunit CcmA
MNGQRVLHDLDVAISAGEAVLLRGNNGTGKTTLLRCVAGLLRPDHGDVSWFGQSHRRSPAANRFVGFAGHHLGLYPELTAVENLRFAARMYQIRQWERRVDDLLESAGLSQRAHQPAGRMSQGMLQRLSLLKSLIHDPPIVLWDEPFSGLDTAGCQWLEDVIHELRQQGCAICFTSHGEIPGHALVDRQYELRDGSLKQVVAPVLVPCAPNHGVLNVAS